MWRRSAKFTYHTALFSLVTVLVLFALMLTVLRYLLPQLPDVTRHVERLLAERYQVTATVAQISADWNRSGPQLILTDLQVPKADDDGALLAVAEARIHFNFWQSLRHWSWQIERVTLANAQFSYDLRQLNQTNKGLAAKPLQQFFLHQLSHIDVRDSAVNLTNLVGEHRQIVIDELRWFNRQEQHQGVGRFRMAGLASNELDMMIRLSSSNPAGLTGQVYVHAEQVDIAPWLQQHMVDIDVAQAQLNFTLWLNVLNGVFDDGLLTLRDTSLQWQAQQQANDLRIASGAMRLRSQGNGWLVNSTPLTVQHNDAAWEIPPLSFEQQPEHWQMSIEQLPIAPLLRVVSPQAAATELSGSLSVKMRQRSQQPLFWQVQGSQLSWPNAGAIPGLQSVDLTVIGRDDQAQWALTGEAVTLQSDAASYTHSWQLPRLALAGDWQWHQGAWQFAVNAGSEIELDGMTLSVSSRLQAVDEDVLVRARVFTTNVEPLAMDTLREHLPIIMGENLHDYLYTGLLDGQADHIAMVWRGRVGEFPYYQQQGSFAAQANLTDVMFKFQPNWLPVYDTNIALNFTNERMHIVATDARLGQMQLPRVDTVIANINAADASLAISGEVMGLAEQLQPIFAQSPLADSVASSLQQVQPSGAITGGLMLTIPLTTPAAGEPAVTATGHVDFANNRLQVTPLGQKFTDFSGRLRFNNERLQADNLRLKWQNLPLQASLNSALQSDAYQLSIDVDADWPLAQAPHANKGLNEIVSGHFKWQSRLEIRLLEGSDYAFHWRQQSTLADVALLLPEPLHKPPAVAWPMQLQVSGGPEHILINMELAERGLLELQLTGDASAVMQGYARVGEAVSLTPNANVLRLNPTFAVDINTDTINLQQWLSSSGALTDWVQAWSAAVTEADTAAQPDLLVPDLIQLSSSYFDLYGYPLGPSKAVLWPDAERGWRLDFEADNAAVSGHIFHNDERLQVDLEAEFVDLPAIDTTSSDDDAPVFTNFSQFPQLSINCKRCRFGSYNLGSVNLAIAPDADGLWLQQLHLQQGRHQLKAAGHWRVATLAQPAQTKLKGNFNSADLGAFLRDQQITTMVQDSPANFDFDLSWQGTPFAYNSATLNGTVGWRLGQGYLNEVSDGAARLFSLLSLEGLIRKLRFDFRDVFANGLFYTEFGGQFSIADGVVRTDNTRLNGSAGDMEINGTVNLVNSELNYQIFYIPKVTSSLPVIVAWMVNPPSGLAALLIDRMLHDAQVISRLEYRITGTLEEPLVEEVARDSREVKLPVEPPPQPLQE